MALQRAITICYANAGRRLHDAYIVPLVSSRKGHHRQKKKKGRKIRKKNKRKEIIIRRKKNELLSEHRTPSLWPGQR